MTPTDPPIDAAMSQLDVCSERLEAAVRQVARQNRRIAALTARLAAAEAVVDAATVLLGRVALADVLGDAYDSEEWRALREALAAHAAQQAGGGADDGR